MRLASIICGALLASVAALPAVAADYRARPADQVPINMLTAEIQRTSDSTTSVDLVWWFPPAFWDVSLSQQEGIDASMRDEIRDLFSKYVVVAVAKGSVGNFGVSGYLGEAEIRGALVLVTPDGSTHAPLADDRLDPRLGVMIGALKPMFAGALGQLGSNLNFFAFPGQRADGSPLVDPLGEGRMTVRLSGVDFPFELPLASLLVPMQDPASGREFPGHYRYNPYSGTPLQPKPSN